MDFTHFQPWYISVLGTILLFWSPFSTFTRLGIIWRRVVIWVYFGDKMRGSSKPTIEQVRGRHLESTIDRCTLYAINQQQSAQSPAGLKPKSRHNYGNTPGQLLT